MNEPNGKVDLNKLKEPFDQSAIKQRPAPGGGKPLDYVAGHTYIRRIIEATGNRYDVAVRDVAYREVGVDGKGNPVVIQTVRIALTIPELGTREGIGVQRLSLSGGEDLAKGALTDALKNAAKYFGLGLDLYGPDYEAYEEPLLGHGATAEDAFADLEAKLGASPRPEARRRDGATTAPPPRKPLTEEQRALAEPDEHWATTGQLKAIKALWERLYGNAPIEARLAKDFQVTATDDLTVAFAASFIATLNDELKLAQRAIAATT